MNCIAIDDEQLVLELLEDNIRQVPFLSLKKTCRNALEAVEVLQDESIDLIFLDIQMPRLNGLQFLKTLQDPPLVILITAYEQYALEGFNLQVADYLLKPFTFERFLQACNRANALFRSREKQPAQKQVTDFFVNVEYTQVKIRVDDIAYVEGLKDYIKIHLTSAEKPVLTRMTIKAIEEMLPQNDFIRTHKSFLVSAQKISTVKRDFVCIGEHEIPVSESYKANISRILEKPEG